MASKAWRLGLVASSGGWEVVSSLSTRSAIIVSVLCMVVRLLIRAVWHCAQSKVGGRDREGVRGSSVVARHN
jgi:hypothetical protein